MKLTSTSGIVLLASLLTSVSLQGQEPTYPSQFERLPWMQGKEQSAFERGKPVVEAVEFSQERNHSERIEHLRIAAENLHQAGFKKEARQVMETAEKLELELERKRSQLGQLPREVLFELRELRESVSALREEVAALRRQLLARENGPVEPTPRVEKPRVKGGEQDGRSQDEELDAVTERRPYFEKSPSSAAGSEPARTTELQFELVPIDPEEATPADQEPVPTPATH